METMKGPSGSVGSGGVNPAPRDEDLTVRVAAEQLLMVPIDDLVPYANNARVHSKAQIDKLRASLREFGFVTPVLIDFDNNIIAGHGRVEAARAEGMSQVPCVLVTNLTEAQQKAYVLADNRLSELASWDEPLLKMELENLSHLEFDTGVIGFDFGDDRLSGFGAQASEPADALDLDDGVDSDDDTSGPKRQTMHCPKCGFVFEVSQ